MVIVRATKGLSRVSLRLSVASNKVPSRYPCLLIVLGIVDSTSCARGR